MRRQRQAGFIRGIVSVVLLVAAIWVALHRQAVLDQFVVWRYTPTSAVSAIVKRAAFSPSGTFVFYASQPSLEGKTPFTSHCSRQEQGSVILGCYKAQRIYVYNVTDARLDGVHEVTAAHEMLHAAYERLSDDERQKVNALIEKEMAHNTDKRLKARLKLYEKTEPGQRDNELHSILGTESAHLGSELEAYYQRYFTNRSAVTSLFAKYEGVFRQLETQQNALVAELNSMGAEIKRRTTAYNLAITRLNADITAFNARASRQGGFTDEAAFAAARAELVQQQQALEAQRADLNRRIALYNSKRTELESLNLRAKELQNSLDSTPSLVPQL